MNINLPHIVASQLHYLEQKFAVPYRYNKVFEGNVCSTNGKSSKIKYNYFQYHIIEEGKFTYNKLKGNWNKIFKNNNPIFLELACGNGEYTINNSIKFQNNNYIGIDIKGSRLWIGGQKLKEIKQ